MCNERHAAPGFTLVEVVIAIVVLTIGILALAASAAATVRSMADGARIAGISRAAENARERAFGSVCATAAGVDSAVDARVVWTAAPAAGALVLRQAVTLSPRSSNVTAITAVGACR